jgi:hypothetical protein
VRSSASPFAELADPLHSPLLAALAGGVISGLVASAFHGAGARLFGGVDAPAAAVSLPVAAVPRQALPAEVVTTTPGFAVGSSNPSREPPRPSAEEIVLLGENDKLAPGTLVIGPPPATHPHGSQASTSSTSLPYLPDPDPDPATSSSVPPKRRPPPPPRRG